MIEYINPFIGSTYSVFRTMMQCDVRRGEPSVNDHFQPQHEISGVIGLSGEVSGTIVLSVNEEVALKATEALIGDSPTEITEDVIDCVGELTNMIAGGAKRELAVFNMCLALPAVITGPNHVIAFGSRVRPVLVPFTTDWGPISVEVGFVQTDALQEAIIRQRERNKVRQSSTKADYIESI